LSSHVAVDFTELSDGELLELMVPSQSISRRILVVWLYLQQRTSISLREFDKLLSSSAEAELRDRAAKVNVTTQKLEETADIIKKLGTARDLEKRKTENV
jgi:hypothetical protein